MWDTIDMLSITCQSDLSNNIKRDFFEAVAVSELLYGSHLLDSNERHGEKAK